MIRSHYQRASVSRRGRGLSLGVAMAGVAALAVGTVGFTSGAGAAGSAKPFAGHFSINASGATNYAAGYAVAPSDGLASANISFTVPTISCTAADESQGAWQDDGIYTADHGGIDASAVVKTSCTSSGPLYIYSLNTLAQVIQEPGAAPGDTVLASMYQTATATVTKIRDLTNGLSFVDKNTVNQGDTLMVFGTLNGTVSGNPVPTYTKANFFNATVNGDYLGYEGASAYNTLNGGDLIVKTSKLTTTATGSSFHTTFEHAT
jgi:hypothetical protein